MAIIKLEKVEGVQGRLPVSRGQPCAHRGPAGLLSNVNRATRRAKPDTNRTAPRAYAAKAGVNPRHDGGLKHANLGSGDAFENLLAVLAAEHDRVHAIHRQCRPVGKRRRRRANFALERAVIVVLR